MTRVNAYNAFDDRESKQNNMAESIRKFKHTAYVSLGIGDGSTLSENTYESTQDISHKRRSKVKSKLCVTPELTWNDLLFYFRHLRCRTAQR